MNKEKIKISGNQLQIGNTVYQLEYKVLDYIINLLNQQNEVDEAVEYWQIECDKRSKVLDKIKPMLEELKNLYDDNYTVSDKVGDILELLEEIE